MISRGKDCAAHVPALRSSRICSETRLRHHINRTKKNESKSQIQAFATLRILSTLGQTLDDETPCDSCIQPNVPVSRRPQQFGPVEAPLPVSHGRLQANP